MFDLLHPPPATPPLGSSEVHTDSRNQTTQANCRSQTRRQWRSRWSSTRRMKRQASRHRQFPRSWTPRRYSGNFSPFRKLNFQPSSSTGPTEYPPPDAEPEVIIVDGDDEVRKQCISPTTPTLSLGNRACPGVVQRADRGQRNARLERHVLSDNVMCLRYIEL